MVEFLKGIIPYLGGAIGALILIVLVREGWRSFRRRHVKTQEEACEELIKRVHHLTTEGLVAVALELKKSFSLDVIEAVLDKYVLEHETKDVSHQIANLYDHLGLIEKYVTQLKEGKNWPKRAEAAEKLGMVGHPGAVLSLISTLRDAQEEKEIKNGAMRALGKIRDPRAIQPLVESLDSPDPATGQPLADILVQFGEETLPVLLETLETSTNEAQRVWSVRILGRLKLPKSVPSLINALSDHSETVRESAAKGLGLIGDRRAVRSLNELLQMDPSPIVREAASEALGKIGDEKAIESLKRALGDMEYGTRLKAMEALESMGEKVWPLFLDVLKNGDSRAKIQAAIALERIGYVEWAVSELARSESGEFLPTFETLLQVAKAGVSETLLRALNHSDFRVRLHLCEILRDAHPHQALETLLEVAQKDSEWPVRLRALEALIALGDEKVMPVILRALKDEEESTRGAVLEAMMKLPPSLLSRLITELIPLTFDQNAEARFHAVALLGRVKEETVILPLLSSLKDPSAKIREIAVTGLGGIRSVIEKNEGMKKRITESLIISLKDRETNVRLATVQSLGLLKDPLSIEALSRSFEWADEDSRDLIASAIVGMPRKEFFLLMDLLMGLDHPKARAGIAWTLGLLEDPKGVKLAGFFLKDPESIVRAAAAGAIGNYFVTGNKRQEEENKELMLCSSGLLLQYLGDPNERVRAAVANALGKIGNPETIEALFSVIDSDPDSYVRQRGVLAIGCFVRSRIIDLHTMSEKIRNWLTRADDDVSKMAGVITLTLWGDEVGIAEGLKALHSKTAVKILKAHLTTLPSPIGERFLNELAYDRELFWQKEIGPEAVAKHYEALLTFSRSVKERSRAIQALVELQVASATSFLEATFHKDPNASVRSQALKGLSHLLHGALLLEKIFVAVSDPTDEVRQEVLSILKQLSPQELKGHREQLIPLLDSPLIEVRESVTTLLARLFQDDWQFLADILLGTDRKNRIVGLIETMGKIGDPKTGPLILQFLEHRNPQIREQAVSWAMVLGFLTEERLKALLEDPQELVRVSTVRGFGEQLSAGMLPSLTGLLKDPSPMVRIEIAVALGRKTISGDKRPTQILTQLLEDLHAGVRMQALISLFRLGETGIQKKGKEMMAELDAEEQKQFILRLDQEGILLELAFKLRNERKSIVRKESLEFLATLDKERFKKEIAEALLDPASDVRLAAIEALGQIEDPEIQKAIGALSQDPIEEVRQAVKRRNLRTVK